MNENEVELTPEDLALAKELKLKKMAASSPLPPAAPPPPPSFITEAIADSKAEALLPPDEKDDRNLAEGSYSDFWKLVKHFIENKQKRLKEMTQARVVASESLNMEDIGFRYLLSDQISMALQDVINFVENRAKLVEQIKREQVENDKANQKS